MTDRLNNAVWIASFLAIGNDGPEHEVGYVKLRETEFYESDLVAALEEAMRKCIEEFPPSDGYTGHSVSVLKLLPAAAANLLRDSLK